MREKNVWGKGRMGGERKEMKKDGKKEIKRT